MQSLWKQISILQFHLCEHHFRPYIAQHLNIILHKRVPTKRVLTVICMTVWLQNREYNSFVAMLGKLSTDFRIYGYRLKSISQQHVQAKKYWWFVKIWPEQGRENRTFNFDFRMEIFCRTLTETYPNVYVISGPVMIPGKEESGKKFIRHYVSIILVWKSIN